MQKTTRSYGLSDRCLVLAKHIRELIKMLPYSVTNQEYSKQLARSSSSIGANFIEASESLSQKDYIHRLRISRKEAKETEYWLQLIDYNAKEIDVVEQLIQETKELRFILSAIIMKTDQSTKKSG